MWVLYTFYSANVSVKTFFTFFVFICFAYKLPMSNPFNSGIRHTAASKPLERRMICGNNYFVLKSCELRAVVDHRNFYSFMQIERLLRCDAYLWLFLVFLIWPTLMQSNNIIILYTRHDGMCKKIWRAPPSITALFSIRSEWSKRSEIWNNIWRIWALRLHCKKVVNRNRKVIFIYF